MTYEQALAIVKKYMAEKHPDWEIQELSPNHHQFDFGGGYLGLQELENGVWVYWDDLAIGDHLFGFYFPATEDEFLTLMSILAE